MSMAFRVFIALVLVASLGRVQAEDPVLTSHEAEEVAALNRAAKEMRDAGVANPNAEQDKIALLRQESLEESLRLLPLDGLEFYLPSLMVVDPSTPITIPLAAASYQRDVTQILYNRRFRKVLAEIQQANPETVTPLLVSALTSTKELFDRLYSESVLGRPHLFAESAVQESAALGAGEWRDPSLEPTLCSVRLGLFAITILAANVAAGDAAPFVANVIAEARDSREYFYRKESGNLRARVYAILSGLYNPIVLGSSASLLSASGKVAPESSVALAIVKLNRFDKVAASAFASEEDTDAISLALIRHCSDSQFDAFANALEVKITSSHTPAE